MAVRVGVHARSNVVFTRGRAETMCMKGLLLQQSGKREEGLELAKRGARFDLTSHIVWHVLGLIYKADRNYEEANRSFTQALRFDKVSLLYSGYDGGACCRGPAMGATLQGSACRLAALAMSSHTR